MNGRAVLGYPVVFMCDIIVNRGGDTARLNDLRGGWHIGRTDTLVGILGYGDDQVGRFLVAPHATEKSLFGEGL